jgi:hypothetical protein
VADDRERPEVFFRVGDVLRTPVRRRATAGVGPPERRNSGGTDCGRRRVDVESGISALTGVRVSTSLQPNPSADTIVLLAPTANETPGRFCPRMSSRTTAFAHRQHWLTAPGLITAALFGTAQVR